MKEQILAAYERIQGMVRETPLEQAAGCGALLKLEHLQHTGSFKFRGAANKIAMLTEAQAQAGVVTASNGNHGLGVAAASQARGIRSGSFRLLACVARESEADRGARRADSLRGGRPADGGVGGAAGGGGIRAHLYFARTTMGCGGRAGHDRVELLRQAPALDAVFVAVGGGGLIGGIGAYLKAVRRARKWWGAGRRIRR